MNTASIELSAEEAQNLLVCIEQTVKSGGPNLPNTCQFYLNMREKLIKPFSRALEDKPDGSTKD